MSNEGEFAKTLKQLQNRRKKSTRQEERIICKNLREMDLTVSSFKHIGH